jgi:hypothetical protein
MLDVVICAMTVNESVNSLFYNTLRRIAAAACESEYEKTNGQVAKKLFHNSLF